MFSYLMYPKQGNHTVCLDSLKNTDHYAKIDEAIDLLQKSAKAGNAKAQYELGNLYWNN